ncbi:MAG TPA: GAF domain-containing protein [Anaerolineae bacterium]|nr:GAF domain-containing protein [Anaerolineae bacterium]
MGYPGGMLYHIRPETAVSVGAFKKLRPGLLKKLAWRNKMVFSLRFKIIFITVAILIFALVVTTLVSSYVFSQEYSDVLQSRTFIIGQGIKSQLDRLFDLGLPLEELGGFEKQLQETVNTYEDITYAMIVNLDGRVLFHNDPSQQGQIITEAAIVDAVQSEKNIVQLYSDQTGQFYDVFIPIFDRSDTHVGAIRLGFPVELVTQKTNRLTILAGGVAFVSLVVAITLLIFALSTWVTKPLTKLLTAIQGIRSGETDLATGVEINSRDEIGELSRAFNTLASQLSSSIDTLEEQVAGRTRQLETVVEISQRLIVILDLNELLRQVVNLTKETFDYYYVHIYLLDKDSKLLQLAEGYGQLGAEMKSRGHSIPLDAKPSLVAQAARTGQPVKVDNVHEVDNWLPNPFLADTYSEIAVPIILDEQIVGVLDVQSDQIAGLDEGDVNLLRSLANEVALAIRNARLFDEVNTALADAYKAQERYLEQAWQKDKLTSQDSQYLYKEPNTIGVGETESQMFVKARQAALATNHPKVIPLKDNNSERYALVAPIQLQGESIGDLQLYTSAQAKWTETDLAVIETILTQVAQSAENLRLFEETRQWAGREQTIREITERMRTATSLEELVKTTAQELGERLAAGRAVVALGLEPETHDSISVPKRSDNGR